MNVQIVKFGEVQEMTLEQALNTSQNGYREGVAECALATANDNGEVMARLLAHMVESGQLELKKAFEIAGVYVEEVERLP